MMEYGLSAKKFKFRRLGVRLLIGMFFFLSKQLTAQTTSYNQFWNDFQFVNPLNRKWGTELNLGQVWTSAPHVNNSFLYANSQLYIRAWIHYYADRWKLSAFTGYNYNQDIEAIKQQELPEVRSALQAIYYFKKLGYILSNRVRFEDRRKKNEKDGFDVNYRLRNQVKFVLPFNGKVIRKGTLYGVVSEEVFTITTTALLSKSLVGSNRFTIGCGYSFTNDFLVEVDYSNDYNFKKSNNELYNTIQLNVSCYNWLSKLKE
jgi:hypothetical protein